MAVGLSVTMKLSLISIVILVIEILEAEFQRVVIQAYFQVIEAVVVADLSLKLKLEAVVYL